MSATLLTTPHGDQEPSAPSPASVSARSPSLPLMGIRNQRQQREQGLEVGISLPLMGIRNTPPGVARRGELDSHYPSWGSGTQLRQNRRRVRQELTTPHGDQERAITRSGLPAPGSHYPSWGSGTMSLRSAAAGTGISLPLMGIRNGRGGGGRAAQARLTTPHGDQEHPCPPPPPRAAQSHYPSWGSGTGCLAGGEPGAGDLTTPHGDQELLDRPGDHRRDVLTTPHGDQEHPSFGLHPGVDITSLPLMGIRNAARLYGSSLLVISLPLMGIRNPVCSITIRTGGCPHYPSWGSGTRFALLRSGLGGVLTTPHGDQELPEVLEAIAAEQRRSLPLMGIRNSSESQNRR